jgi:hypothetical protein
MADLRDMPGISTEWMAALDALVAASLVPAVLQRQQEVRAALGREGREAGDDELSACRQEVVDEYVRTLRTVRAARVDTPAAAVTGDAPVGPVPPMEIPTTPPPSPGLPRSRPAEAARR